MAFGKMPGLREGGAYRFKVVPSGYEFLGPGNEVAFQVPRNANDAIAKQHDIDYGRIQQRGGNPYITWTEADETFLRDLRPNDVPTWVAKGLFEAKKLAGKWGLIGTSFGNMPGYNLKFEKGKLQKKDLEWLHANDATDTEESPKKADDAGDWEMEDINGNTSGPTRGEKRDRGEEQHPGSGKQGKMEGMADVTGAKGVPALGAMAGQVQNGGANGTGETPVDLMVKPQLGLFTETHTAILPLRFCASFIKCSAASSGTVLKIRMNAPYNILADTTFVKQTESSASAEGMSSHQAIAYTTNHDTTFTSFETSLSAATTGNTASETTAGIVSDGNCKPGWRNWFEKIYDSYHTIETHYKITFTSPETTIGQRVRVFVDKDVYTTSSTGNIMPVNGPPIVYNSVWKGVDTIIVQERNNNDSPGWIKSIQGVWRPNEWSKNTLNSTDIKAWYTTGAAPSPAWIEELVLLARTDEHNPNNYANLNCLVELRYVVQFKDLKQTYRYVNSTDSDIALNTPGDVVQVPFIRNDWGSPA